MIKEGNIQQNIAIVWGPKCVNATGLIRSLGEKGYYVLFASTYPKIESKYVKGYLRLPKSDEAQVETILEYVRALPSKPAIFTVDDHCNYLLDEAYQTFEKYAFIPHAKGRLRELSDKSVMSKMAQENGLNAPAFEKVDLTGEVVLSLQFPVILKPYAGYAGSKGDIRVCATKEDADAWLQTLREKGYKEVLAQELLCDKEQFEIGLMGISLPNGEVEIPCSIRKIRSYPEGRGSTSYAQVKRDFFGVDLACLKNFIRDTGYVGIFDVEMIVDGGKPYFIEINYRNGQYGYAPTKAGYNLPANWFCGMMGKDVEKQVAVEEIFYMNEREDKLHVRDGKLSKKEWKRQFNGASAYGMYCKEDQRPYVRQYVKIPDRLTIAWKKFWYRISDLLVKEEWNVAVRPRGEQLLFENKDTKGFVVLKNNLRYWCADPFVFSKDGKDYVFFEMYDRFKAKGVIGYREITAGKIGKMKKAYETSSHLSFPNIFTYNGGVYMMPESCGNGKLSVLRAVQFPDKWEESQVVLEKRVCDSVFLSTKDKVYLLTQPMDLEESVLECYEVIDGRASKGETIVKGKKYARMAGAIIQKDGESIRVSQDCVKGYGLAIDFHKICECNNEKYSEETLQRVEIADMPKEQRKKYVGLHTYNLSERYEAIDLKNQSRVRFGNVINIFYRIVRKLKKWII